MSFREPLWTILFPEAYAESRRQLLRDWSMMAGGLVAGIVGLAFVTQPGLF